MEYFSTATLQEIIKTVQGVRPLQDLELPEKIQYDVPISRPQEIICLGRNYKKHAEEFDSTVPQQPMFFSKLSSSLLPHRGVIKIPSDVGRVDHEIELAVVIGEVASKVAAKDAYDYIAGYTIANDITARDMQKTDIKDGKPWTLSKGFDTFCPMGPYLVPADSVQDPHNLELELLVNGEVRQKSNTRYMVFKIPELVAYISKYVTLQPGDIICTGTPEGVSPIKPGDEIVATIEGLGTLKNTVAV
ncbi:fumarylacetoacetate hydrolase family protein [candidate division KSB1 bacterium]|nr:fumarylacetoacetate hydrolase family protein [candidate division KSB1 bacterium]